MLRAACAPSIIRYSRRERGTGARTLIDDRVRGSLHLQHLHCLHSCLRQASPTHFGHSVPGRRWTHGIRRIGSSGLLRSARPITSHAGPGPALAAPRVEVGHVPVRRGHHRLFVHLHVVRCPPPPYHGSWTGTFHHLSIWRASTWKSSPRARGCPEDRLASDGRMTDDVRLHQVSSRMAAPLAQASRLPCNSSVYIPAREPVYSWLDSPSFPVRSPSLNRRSLLAHSRVPLHHHLRKLIFRILFQTHRDSLAKSVKGVLNIRKNNCSEIFKT